MNGKWFATGVVFGCFLTAQAAWSPAPGQTIGQWEFNGDLGSATGQVDLEAVGFPGVTPGVTFTNAMIGGQVAEVAELTDGTALVVRHGAPPNGGGSYVNQYTLVMDVLFPVVGEWISLYQTNEAFDDAGGTFDLSDSNDGDWFLNADPGAGIGISGNYGGGPIDAGTWYRLALVVDLAAGTYTSYINGIQVQQNTGQGVDGRFALYGPGDPDPYDWFFLFADESGDPGAPSEMGAVSIGSFLFMDSAAPPDVIAGLGGPSAAGIELPTQSYILPSDTLYLYDANDGEGMAGSGSAFDALDGTWSHDNGSDEWDGTGQGEGRPGGVTVADGFIRIQDTGDPRDHGMGDPGSNRKIYLGHDLSADGASSTLLDDGVTLYFRARVAPGGDDIHPDGGGAITPLPEGGDGYVIHDGGKGPVGIKQASGGIVSFGLTTDFDGLGAAGLVTNNLNGTEVSGDVDQQGGVEGGDLNLLPLDVTRWHDYYITIRANGAGTHHVTVYLDGSLVPAVEWDVTAGSGSDFGDITYLGLGAGATPQSGAIDTDFVAVIPRADPPARGLVTHLTFDAADALIDRGPGGNDGTFFDMDAEGTPVYVEDRNGNPDSAILFDGVDDYVSLAQNSYLPIVLNRAFTVAMWVNGAPQNDRRVFSEGSSSNNAPLFNLGVRNTPAVNSFLRDDGNAGIPGHRAGSRVAFDETWHHIAWVDVNGSVTLYVDGVPDTSRDWSYPKPDVWSLNTTSIGAILRGGDCCWFAGAIDDVRLYDVALSEVEVQDIVSRPDCDAVSDTTCTGIAVDGPVNNVGFYTLTAGVDDTSGDTEFTYTFEVTNADDGTTFTAGPQAENSATFFLEIGSWTAQVTIDDDPFCFDFGDINTCTTEILIDPPPELVSHFAFDGDLLDSANGNDGSMVGAVAEDPPPVPMFATGFDGTPNGAILLDGASLVSAMHNSGLPIYAQKSYTVAMWVNGPPAQPDLRIFSEGSTTNGTPLINLGTANDGATNEATAAKADVFIRPGATLIGHAKSDRDIYDETWHHIAWVDDNGHGTLYIDGVRDANSNLLNYIRPGGTILDTTTIGGILRASPSHFFNGAIDEVRLYNYALSAEEVRGLIPEREGCPGDSDTVCTGFEVTNSAGNPIAPGGSAFGVVTLTATATDGTGDPVLHTFTAVSDSGEVLQSGPGVSNVAQFDLAPGIWTLTYDADDDLFCHDPADVGDCPPVMITALSVPPTRITHLPLDGDYLDTEPAGNDGSIVGDGDVPFVFDGFDCNPAASFDGTNFLQLAQNAHLPLNQNPSFSLAMWVRGMPQADRRVFSEASTTTTNPLFNIGTDNNGATGVVDLYIRSGANPLNHVQSDGIAFDGTWHHIAWTDDNGAAILYIDGEPDPTDFTYVRPDWSALNTTTVGGILRASACCQFTGDIDDVQLFNYVLSPEDVAEIYGDGPSDDCCPTEGDTHCNGLEVTQVSGEPGAEGTFEAAVTAIDDSGDPILYTFTITDVENGGEPLVIGPQESSVAQFDLPRGSFSVSASVDDDPECDDVAADAMCEPVAVTPGCPIDGDTHCTSLMVLQVSGEAGEAGTYQAEAMGVDDTGDTVLYTFTVAPEGDVDPIVVGPQESNTAEFDLDIGTYTVSVSVDDDPECDDVAADASCEPVTVDVACPSQGDTICSGVVVSQTSGEPDGPGTYQAEATATDDSGDTILYTFTITRTDNGGQPVVIGPQSSNVADFDLDVGTFDVSVSVDDDPDCDDPEGECSATVTVELPGGGQIPGDANQDGEADLSDAVKMLRIALLGDPMPCDTSEANAQVLDWDGASSGAPQTDAIADALALLNWAFLGQAAHVLGLDCIPIEDCPNVCEAP